MSLRLFVGVCLLFACPLTLIAAESPEAPVLYAGDEASTDAAGNDEAGSDLVNWDTIIGRFYAGRFRADDEPQFAGIRNQYAFGLGLGVDLEHYPMVGLDFDLFLLNRDFDTPLPPPVFGTIDNDTSLMTTALLFGARVQYPPSQRLRVYAAGGLGLFRTEMRVSGSTFGLPGEITDNKQSLDLYVGAGVSLTLDRWSLSFDYRRFSINGSFSEFRLEDVAIGGDVLVAGINIAF